MSTRSTVLALDAHTPWAQADFDRRQIWLACSCGWNRLRKDQGRESWNDHFRAAAAIVVIPEPPSVSGNSIYGDGPHRTPFKDYR